MGKFLLTIAMLLGIADASAEKILKTTSLNDIARKLSHADSKTLVLFDCDRVLLRKKDKIFASNNREVRHAAEQYLREQVSRDVRDHLRGVRRRQCVMELLDENWKKVISNLKRKGIHTAVLTAHSTGSLYGIDRIESVRIDELRQLGLNFQQFWPEFRKPVVWEIEQEEGDTYDYRTPIFEQGIFFCCQFDKGEIIRSFLETYPYDFDKIIFVDDKSKHIEEVQRVAEEMGMKYVGIQYTKYKTLKGEKADLSQEKRRMDILMNQEQWLSDEQL